MSVPSKPVAAFAVLAAGLSISCVHQQVGKTAAATPKPAVAPVNAWDQQIRNAVNVGEGDYELGQLRQKVAGEPENVAARLELAKAYRERGYHEIALEISRLAVARFPESGAAQLSLVRDLRDVNQRAEAVTALENFVKAHPASAAEYYSWLGILRDESGLWPLGEPAHRKAIELAPSTDYLHNNLGYNLLMQKKNEAAAEEFREALKLNPASQMARNNLGIVLAQSNAPAQAVANWQEASDPATAHNNLAAIWIEKGNYPEARKELDLALGYNRAHSAALKNLELVGRLDGNPATLNATPAMVTGWQRFGHSVRKLFVGPLDDSRAEAAKNASVH
jgi:tetratricopeptide (TPR) repeat protein